MDADLRPGPRPATRRELTLAALAFVFLAACLTPLWLAFKPAPALWLLAPLFVHALAAALHADGARRTLGAVSLWAAMMLAATVAIYALAVALSPSHRIDGHPTMPLGQLVIATVAGPAVGCAAAWLFGRKVPAVSFARDLLLFGLLAVLVAARGVSQPVEAWLDAAAA